MIFILFGASTEKTNYVPELMFNNAYSFDWFSDPVVKRIVKEIDKSDLLGRSVRGPWGNIPFEKLSCTAKTLILMLKKEKYFETDLIYIGNNGFQLFADISKVHDIYCVLTGSKFTMRGINDFDFYCLNDKSYASGYKDWMSKLETFHDNPGDCSELLSVRGGVTGD